MNDFPLSFCGAMLRVLPSGALWWPDRALLCVSDLHLGKSDRIARRLGLMLPPYDVVATLDRLDTDLTATTPQTVVCLGDSFDDDAAQGALDPVARARLQVMMAGRRWVWILGNHDPGPVDLGGTCLAELAVGPLTFRHQAQPGAAPAEVSGHYHPKLALPGAGPARRCFVHDAVRLILPAYGAYTGGLSARDPALRSLLGDPAFALLIGRQVLRAPLPVG